MSDELVEDPMTPGFDPYSVAEIYPCLSHNVAETSATQGRRRESARGETAPWCSAYNDRAQNRASRLVTRVCRCGQILEQAASSETAAHTTIATSAGTRNRIAP
jgi:hypothetical protein